MPYRDLREYIDRLEEKVKLLVGMIDRLRGDGAKADLMNAPGDRPHDPGSAGFDLQQSGAPAAASPLRLAPQGARPGRCGKRAPAMHRQHWNAISELRIWHLIQAGTRGCIPSFCNEGSGRTA